MATRHIDGSVGDSNYAAIGGIYSIFRQPGDRRAVPRRILNIGAGAGSYEPMDRDVEAIAVGVNACSTSRPADTNADLFGKNSGQITEHFEARRLVKLDLA